LSGLLTLLFALATNTAFCPTSATYVLVTESRRLQWQFWYWLYCLLCL